MSSLQDVFQCESPVALITGSGSRRVGRVIAEHLARLGCRIALHANTSVHEAQQAAESMIREFQVDVMVASGDLEDPSVPERIVAEVHARFGRMDVLVNSAAIWHPTPLEQITAEELLRYYRVNTMAPFLAARAAGMIMVGQPAGGSIVNLGDWATCRPYLDHAAYFPSKGAIEVMTRSLAVELGSRHPQVRVNCIQPGPVLLTEDASPQHRRALENSTLVGRVGTAEQVASAVQFLCENAFVTGVCLPVDGGRSIYAPDGLQAGLNTG